MTADRRPSYTARPGEAAFIMFHAGDVFTVGAGRVTVQSADMGFVDRVVADIGRLVHTQAGDETLRRGDAIGQPVVIRPPDAPTDPPNGWVIPPGTQAGEGGASVLVYDPADWPRRGEPLSPSSDAVLLTLLRLANARAGGMPPGGGGHPPEPAPASASADLRLTCQPSKDDDRLVFRYAVENLGRQDVYVMDAMPTVDPAGACVANPQAAAVMLGGDGDVVLGKFVPPLPTDRHMALPAAALAARVGAGGRLERQLVIPPPLAEASPYFADLTLRQYDMVEARGVVFTLSYWVRDGDAPPAAPYAPDLVQMPAARPVRHLWQRFATSGLQIFRRGDAYPRSFPQQGTRSG